MNYKRIFNKLSEIADIEKDLPSEITPMFLVGASNKLNLRIWCVYEFGKFKISTLPLDDNTLFGKGTKTSYFKTQKEVLACLNSLQ